MPAPTRSALVLDLLRRRRFVRGTDLDRLGVHRMELKRLVDAGLVVRRARGVYEAADAELGGDDDLTEVAVRAPGAVVCLLSALRLHGVTSQNPFDVWLMIERRARTPRIASPAVRIVRASGVAWREGRQRIERGGVRFEVTTPAKTVVDCFKYRRRVGTDVAHEALREVLREKLATRDELLRLAKVDRVAARVEPLLDAFA